MMYDVIDIVRAIVWPIVAIVGLCLLHDLLMYAPWSRRQLS